jgi:hypothetical protein
MENAYDTCRRNLILGFLAGMTSQTDFYCSVIEVLNGAVESRASYRVGGQVIAQTYSIVEPAQFPGPFAHRKGAEVAHALVKNIQRQLEQRRAA